jgi:hypothetical protein
MSGRPVTKSKYWIKTSVSLDITTNAKLTALSIVLDDSKQRIMRAAISHMYWHLVKDGRLIVTDHIKAGGNLDGPKIYAGKNRKGVLQKSGQKDRLGKRRSKKRV